jgi:restriction endonuclease Mrr
MTAFCHPIASALTTVAVFIAMSSAAAQSPQSQRTSVHVQAQIQKSAELQRQALQNLTDLERAEDLINNAYAQLQAALSTTIIKASRSPALRLTSTLAY